MCANWEEIQVGRHIERIGVESFGVKSLGSHFKFPENRGRKYKGSVPKTGLNKNCNMMGLEQDGGKQ